MPGAPRKPRVIRKKMSDANENSDAGAAGVQVATQQIQVVTQQQQVQHQQQLQQQQQQQQQQQVQHQQMQQQVAQQQHFQASLASVKMGIFLV